MANYRLFLLPLLILIVPTLALASLNSGLIDYYSFNDGTGLDLVGLNHLNNLGTTNTTGINESGRAYSGVGQYMLNSSFSNADTVKTISLWINVTTAGNNDVITSFYFDSTDRYLSYFSSGKVWSVFPTRFIQTSPNTLATGTWHNVVFIFGSTGHQVYIDGVLNISNTSATGTILSTMNDFYLGFSPGNDYFTGVMDEVGIWNRVLTENEIIELWADGLGYFFPVNRITLDVSYEKEVIETEETSFILNFVNESITDATLYYNNTAYNTTKTTYENNTNFTTTLTAPYAGTLAGNINFYWTYNESGILANTSVYSQKIYELLLDNCTTASNQTANVTLIDESNQSSVYGDVTGSFTYWLNNRLNNKTYTVNWNNINNTNLCINPRIATINAEYDLTYSANNYPQRNTKGTKAFTNVTQNLNLYLLNTAQGLYVRFRTVNNFDSIITGVIATAYKTISGTTYVIETEVTDDSGLATFWIDPDDIYTFSFYKASYGTTNITLRPTSTDIYTVTLGTGLNFFNVSGYTGILSEFTPSDVPLINNTWYPFTFVLNSGYWTITSCTLDVIGDNGTVLNTSSGVTDTGCNLTTWANTYNYTSVYSRATYTENETSTFTETQDFSIRESYIGEFSLMTFINDIKNFNGAGFNTFTRALIAFIIIASIVFGLSRTVEVVADPEKMIVLIIVLVWIMSYLGFFTIGTVSTFPAEIPHMAQYAIFYIITLLGTGMLMLKGN